MKTTDDHSVKALEKWLSNAHSYTSDSRAAHADSVFVALKGEHNDGHSFVAKLLDQQNIRGFVISEEHFKQNQAMLLQKRSMDCFWVVQDTHETHRQIARYFRSQFKGTVIAVGGSSGKTSCKEFLAQILKAIGKKTVATYKSQNGEQGIPKTLESLNSQVDVAVIEIGIDGPGDMIRHVEIVNPNYSILTSIGEEHLNLLKNIQGVFTEERVLFDHTRKMGGRCFAPQSDEWLSKMPDVELVPDSPELVDASFNSNLTGVYPRRNAALAAFVCLKLFPQDKNLIAKSLNALIVPEGRGRVVSGPTGRIWVEDHYNSNPSSLRAALHQAKILKSEHRKEITLVLGDMLDLGSESLALHQSLLPDLRALNPHRVILIGPMMNTLKSEISKFAKNIESYPDSAAAALSANFSQWNQTITVFKGSRGMALEKVLNGFQSSEDS